MTEPARVTRLGTILPVDGILLDVDAADAGTVLRTLGALLSRRIGGEPQQIAEALAARERLGSTALGHGFALPHARLPSLASPEAAFVRTRAPVDFGAPDRRSVRQFLALLVPAHTTDHHLRLLAEAAELLGDRTFRESLRVAETPADVAELFARQPAT